MHDHDQNSVNVPKITGLENIIVCVIDRWIQAQHVILTYDGILQLMYLYDGIFQILSKCFALIFEISFYAMKSYSLRPNI